MELTGTIHSISDTQQVTEKFRKRELILIIDQDAKYPQHIAIEAVQDNCSLFDGYSKGDEIKASLNVRGRLYQAKDGTEKAFNSFHCWKVERIGQEPRQEQEQPAGVSDDTDDLPF